jgi:PAS domain S-box-containing protein
MKNLFLQDGLFKAIPDSSITAQGKIIGVLSIFQDISKLEKITSELSTYRRMVKELDAIIESSYDGFYITDGQANTLRVNSSWEKITGLGADDVIGKNMADLERQGYFSKSVILMVLKEKRPLTIQAKSDFQVREDGNDIKA